MEKSAKANIGCGNNNNRIEANKMVRYIANKIPLAGVKTPATFCIFSKSLTRAIQIGINTAILSIKEAVIVLSIFLFQKKLGFSK